MNICNDIAAVRQQVRAWRQQGLTIAFVPTMGNLHQGHITLVKQAQTLADKVIVSIFVNPMQFNNADDLANYPSTMEQDCDKLVQQGADCLFTPTPELMYPEGLENHTRVDVPGIADLLEGALRPGHYRGVSTVVTKLFNIVQPDIACFGDKDFQQTALIRKMTSDLALPIEIVGVPTVREPSGLAMSSRNGYLTTSERAIAPTLFAVMQHIAEQISAGNRNFTKVIEKATNTLNSSGFKTDSIDIVDADNLLAMTEKTQRVVILMAAFLGKARLIDNQTVDLHPASI
ncbi:pantoate--beta-alanine ligase [Motilimonas pumila]|uniref:Pantothenate synthetase n=1 Tax=Motilimonas pumila TaxID=2303987 RepID=A0A418YC34_9GAMM|nr:pantoate--beta-alanine ligase [Motilimonas pumila]RJG42071.1 pantoate--beta-alanine ligase [Motilimonas pumila]